MQIQVNSIVAQKNQRQNKLKRLRNNYISCVYEGALKNKSISDIHKEIRKISVWNANNGVPYDKNLENYAFKLTKKAKNEEKVGGAVGLSLFLLGNKVYSSTNKLIYDNGRHFETVSKEDLLKSELEHNRSLEDPKVLYLSSSHKDSAEDHEDYQGKLYYDENWKKYVRDPELRIQIQDLINKKHMKSFQWVTGAPVWLVTRPNCRHFFKAISTSEALGHTYRQLQRKYKTKLRKGDRQYMQTYAHDTRKQWYIKENVENIIQKYKDRLAYHQELSKKANTSFLTNAIAKDKYLIAKWEKYLQNGLK